MPLTSVARWPTSQPCQTAAGPFSPSGGVGAAVLLVQGGLLLLMFGVLAIVVGTERSATPWIRIHSSAFGRSVWIGVLASAPALIVMKLLLAVNARVPLGTPPGAWVVFDGPWSPAFWAFMAVGSYGLVPVLEEMVYRGRMLPLLEARCGSRMAALLTGVFFGLIHGQFYRADLLNLTMLMSLVVAGVAFGLVALGTRSLVAPIVMHALMNVPIAPPFDLVAVAVAIVLLLPGLRWLKTAWSSPDMTEGSLTAAARAGLLVVAASAAISLSVAPALSLAVGTVILGVSSVYVRRRSPRPS